MKGFLLGLLVAGLAAGGYLYWKQHGFGLPARAPAAVADAGAPVKEVKEKKKRRRRGATRLARIADATPAAATEPGGGAPAGRERERREPPPPPPPLETEPERVSLSAADLRTVSKGDDLSHPDVIRMDMTDDSGTHELSADEIDGRFRAKEEAILSCIARARPDEETYVPGRVTVKFRIQRTGNVRGVRVEAPAILQKGGLYGCIKGVVGGIRFPPSSGSQVLSYPFALS